MSRAVAVRRLGAEALPEVVDFLSSDSRANLLLLDLARRFGEAPPAGETPTELAGAFRGSQLVGVASLRPTIVIDSAIEPAALDALAPLLEGYPVGLIKSEALRVDRLWSRFARRRRRVLVDRFETAYVLAGDGSRLVEAGPERTARGALAEDLEPLVFAARESLREEDRPDPFAGDLRGFRRWVQSRVPRAWLIEAGGRVRYVGYADVQRPEGWLLQGVYTWPDARRQGHAAAGTSDLCRRAFAAGAEHVQLAVVEGNDPARRLYEGLGFKPFGRLRTILFA